MLSIINSIVAIIITVIVLTLLVIIALNLRNVHSANLRTNKQLSRTNKLLIMMLNEQNSDRFKIGIDNKFIRDDKNDIEV